MIPTSTEVSIEKLIPEGKALGRLADGRIVIAQGAIPGDRILLERFSERKGLVSAQSFRLVAASPLRVTPSCSVAERCGGCDWMMLRIQEQRQSKIELLKEALWRTGKIDFRERGIELFIGQRAEGYRGRVRLAVQHDRIGFYQRGSHELIEPERCAVSSPAVNAALGELRLAARAQAGALGCFTWLEVREGSDGSVSVWLERNDRALSPAARAFIQALRAKFIVVASSSEAESPQSWQRFQLTDDTFMLSSPASFTQVNWEVNRLLIRRVLDGAAARGINTFLDAYAGSGNFALPLLAQGLSGLAVEANPSAVLAAREAARRQTLPADGFVVADAAAHAEELWRQGRRFDLVLVDPPRAGVKVGLEPLSRLAQAWFLMCSCNPVTLARDLRSALDLGFSISELEAFDMFPQTHHLETLAWLRAPAAR